MFKKKNFRKIKSFQKIFVSKPEIKHLNSKAIVTVYTYNVQGKSLFKKVKKLILLKNLIFKVILILKYLKLVKIFIIIIY